MEELEERQLFEEFARDFNLTDEEIGEIESNEKFKEPLYRMLKAKKQHIIDGQFTDYVLFTRYLNQLVFNMTQRECCPIADNYGLYGLSRSLLHKLTASNDSETADPN